LANRTKMPMWTAKSSGTMKPGIKSHGSVVRLTAGVFFAFSTFGDEGSGPPAGSAGHRRDAIQSPCSIDGFSAILRNSRSVFPVSGGPTVDLARSGRDPASYRERTVSRRHDCGDDPVQCAAKRRLGGRRSGERRGCQRLGALPRRVDRVEPPADDCGPCGGVVAQHRALPLISRLSGVRG
jgi:hypothetical protein